MKLLFSTLLQAGAASAAWAPVAGVIVAVIAAAFGISLIGKSAMEAIPDSRRLVRMLEHL